MGSAAVPPTPSVANRDVDKSIKPAAADGCSAAVLVLAAVRVIVHGILGLYHD